MKPHKWAKEIKCFIEGGEVERKNINGDEWYLITDIGEFSIDYTDYRIKKQPKEPQYLYVYHTIKGIELGYAPHNYMNMYNTKIVGKIKLENEDAI